MKLDNRRKVLPDEYRCDLTRELDELAKLSKKHYYDCFYHYILADKWCKDEKCLALRVPGCTVGSITIDNNNVITKIVIDTDYVVKTYPNNVNDLMQKYVGEIIEY